MSIYHPIFLNHLKTKSIAYLTITDNCFFNPRLVFDYTRHLPKCSYIQSHSFITILPSNKFHSNTPLGISSARRRLNMAYRENEFDIVASKL